MEGRSILGASEADCEAADVFELIVTVDCGGGRHTTIAMIFLTGNRNLPCCDYLMSTSSIYGTLILATVLYSNSSEHALRYFTVLPLLLLERLN